MYNTFFLSNKELQVILKYENLIRQEQNEKILVLGRNIAFYAIARRQFFFKYKLHLFINYRLETLVHINRIDPL